MPTQRLIGSSREDHNRDKNIRILYSFATRVAAILPDGSKIQTEIKYSRTTQRHLKHWGVTPDNRWRKVPHQVLDNL